MLFLGAEGYLQIVRVRVRAGVWVGVRVRVRVRVRVCRITHPDPVL